MKNKTLAIFGIATYALSVLASAENLEGNSVVPGILIIVSGIATIVFIIMATVRLWKEARNLSITFFSSAIILFILTIIQMFASFSYGSPGIVLTNMARVFYFIMFICVVIKLFRLKNMSGAIEAKI